MLLKVIAALALVCFASPSFAADSSALPPPTSVQDAPEAVETVPSKSPRTGGAASGPENTGDVELRVYRRDDGSIVEGPCTQTINAPLARLPWYRRRS